MAGYENVVDGTRFHKVLMLQLKTSRKNISQKVFTEKLFPFSWNCMRAILNFGADLRFYTLCSPTGIKNQL